MLLGFGSRIDIEDCGDYAIGPVMRSSSGWMTTYGSLSANPIVRNGVVYLQDLDSTRDG